MVLITTLLLATLSADVRDGLGVRSEANVNIHIEPLFGPESPGPYKHPASITELDNGDLYIAYYGGSGEYGSDTAVYGSRRPNGSKKWTDPVVIADTPFQSDGNAVVWQSPDGRVWLFYVWREGETWSSSRIKAKVSEDGAKTWSDSVLMTTEEGTMVRGRPIVAPDGMYLVPVYHETGMDTESVGADSSSFFLRIDPKHNTWTETNRIHSRIGNIQPAADVIRGNDLVAFCRRGGGYDGRRDGFIVRSESHDAGKTWSQGAETDIPNPNAAVDFLRLASGKHLLVYNDSFDDRWPLTLMLSTDGAKSFGYKRDITSGEGDFAYPYLIQGKDGKIRLVFTSDARTVINLATFDEDAIFDPQWQK